MFLSDGDIKKAFSEGRIKISPKPDWELQLGPCSVDFRLGNVFRVFNHSSFAYIDPKKNYENGSLMKEIVVKEGEPFIMQPNEFALAVTEEDFEIDDKMVGLLQGRSSLGRLGIIVHSTAAVFNPGWKGKVTMEMGNLGRMPVALYPGMRVCAMMFAELTSKVEVSYGKKKGSKYAGQKDPMMSKISMEL